ncbi:MAG: acyltransferase family protein [Methyloligellaceae bacterium]
MQGLRGLAVLAVLLFHFQLLGAKGGFLGVDIFFVLSGYLITGIVTSKKFDLSWRTIGHFFHKRIWRIVPAYLTTILLTLCAGWFIFLPADFERLGEVSLYSIPFASNFYFAGEAGYFDISSKFKPLLHTWSLAVEMQFYLLWPLIFATNQKLALTSPKILTLIVFFLCLTAGFALAVGDPEAGFFALPSRLWEFALGGFVVFVQRSDTWQRLENYGAVVGWASLVLLITSIFFIDRAFMLPVPFALIPVVATAALIFIGRHAQGAYRILTTKFLTWLGEISYSLYLVHWPVIVFFSYLLFPEPSLSARCLALLLCILLATVLHRFIEEPLRAVGRAGTFKMRFAVGGVAAVTLAVVSSFYVYTSGGLADRFPKALRTALSKVTQLGPTPQNCTPEDNVLGQANCTPVTNVASQLTVAVWGDSHARQFEAVLSNHLAALGTKVMKSSTLRCPPFPGVVVKSGTFSQPKSCIAKNRSTLRAIAEDKQITTVILAARWPLYTETVRVGAEEGTSMYLTDGRWSRVSIAKSKALFKSTMTATVATLRNHGKRVVIIGPVPEFGFDPVRCVSMNILAKTSLDNCASTRLSVATRQAFTDQTLAQIASPDPNIIYLPMAPVFCDSKVCSPLAGGKLLYRDNHHINHNGALYALERAFGGVFGESPASQTAH